MKSVRNIYRLFRARGFETVVMGASFRNAGEIEALVADFDYDFRTLLAAPGIDDVLESEESP